MMLDGSFTCFDGLDKLHFSPFKDASPEPIESIIQTYRHKQSKIPKKDNYMAIPKPSTSPRLEKNYTSSGYSDCTPRANPIKNGIKKMEKNTF